MAMMQRSHTLHACWRTCKARLQRHKHRLQLYGGRRIAKGKGGATSYPGESASAKTVLTGRGGKVNCVHLNIPVPFAL